MSYPEIIHISPSRSGWLVTRLGDGSQQPFTGLGEAIDAASGMTGEGSAFRIVIHETPTAPLYKLASTGFMAA